MVCGFVAQVYSVVDVGQTLENFLLRASGSERTAVIMMYACRQRDAGVVYKNVLQKIV